MLSLSFGLAFALVLPRVPAIPGPLAWGGLLMPLLWTAMSYGLMGVVNPVLQERVDWPWFMVSQFVFGIVAAIVVVRSEASLHSAGRARARSTSERSSQIRRADEVQPCITIQSQAASRIAPLRGSARELQSCCCCRRRLRSARASPIRPTDR